MRGTEVKAVGSRGIMPQHRIFCRPPLTAKLSESLCLFLAQKPQTHPHSRSKTCFSVMQIATLTDSLQKQDNKWSNICIPHLCSGFPGQVKWMENSYLAKKNTMNFAFEPASLLCGHTDSSGQRSIVSLIHFIIPRHIYSISFTHIIPA